LLILLLIYLAYLRNYSAASYEVSSELLFTRSKLRGTAPKEIRNLT